MNVTLTTPYNGTVVSVANAATQVFGDATYDSTKLTRDINACVRRAINYCQRAFIQETYTMTLDKFPQGEVIYTPYGKLQSITSLKYYDEAGNDDTLVENTDFRIDTTNPDYGRIYPIETGTGWPSDVDEDRLGGIRLVYVAGEGSSLTASKHDDFVSAVLLDVGTLYEIRQSIGEQVYNTKAYEMLLNYYKIYKDFHLLNA